jgi:EAL domain-containing protein (putative c-di-GMP-specific phosphodiesterase class I)
MITSKEIQQGLARHEFSAFYQPKFAVDTAQIAGSEALLRWLRPDGSVVFPAAFIGEAERSSLISEISAYLVDLLMQDMEILQREQFTPVSFNASTHDFKDDTLVRKLLTAIAEHKIEPNQVEVEITEHAALSGQKPVLDNMFRLREAGLGLAMDDYGLAYSSADTLSKWPFSAMKIDQGLIARMLFA